MSLGDVARIVQSGGPDSIFLLLVFIGALLGGRIYVKREVDYRDQVIEQLRTINERQQSFADAALRTIREEVLPMLEHGASKRGGGS